MANTPLSWFFNHKIDVKNSYYLSGLAHLDSFIVNRKCFLFTGHHSPRDLQKTPACRQVGMSTPITRRLRDRLPANHYITGQLANPK
jgi:hypothetical protein